MKSKNNRSGRQSSSHNSNQRNTKISSSGSHTKRGRLGGGAASHARGRQSAGSSVSLRISLGIHAVKEVLKVRPTEVFKLIIRKNWESSQDLQDLMRDAKKYHITVEERAPEALDRIGAHHQGVVCEINDLSKNDNIADFGKGEFSVILVLDGVEDPHNLGAILRTAWLMGVEAIILPLDRAVGLTPTVHKVSCGGVEHVPVIRVPNLGLAMEHLKEKGFWIYGLAAGGSKTIGQLKIASKVVWVLGAEDKGLRSTTERACDDLVSIPQLDNAASYNVSVATGITLYETRRQTNSEKV